MRALISGAVNDHRTRILLDTGANISVVSTQFAKRHQLRKHVRRDKSVSVKGFTNGKLGTNERVLAKITLGWNVAYEFELWVMAHDAGVDVVLGTDFMIPAGVRLDLFDGTAKVPDEIVVPLLKTANMEDLEPRSEISSGPKQSLAVDAHETTSFTVRRDIQPSSETHELWVKRTKKLVPSLIWGRQGRVKKVLLTNVSDELSMCPEHTEFLVWAPVGVPPRGEGFVRPASRRFNDWQVLAYEGSRDKSILRKEEQLYQSWLRDQPNCVDRPKVPDPAGILTRDGVKYLDRQNKRAEREQELRSSTGKTTEEHRQSSIRPSWERSEDHTARRHVSWADGHAGGHGQPPAPVSSSTPEDELTKLYVAAALAEETRQAHGENETTYEHEGNDLFFEDYAHELAFLPEVEDAGATALDYDGGNVANEDLNSDQQAQLRAVLKTHESIMIASGNALPPPAYGVVCDIDVEGHAPIKQKSRRVPLKFLEKLYKLLKGLLAAGLIAFSDSQWASPIVIVIKKNGVDIRLCSDYKLLNAVSKGIEYCMPLVDDLLTEMEAYLWFCSLDAASGFWAVVMTFRARRASAFICPLGHFEWLRMPFGLKNAPMIYQRMIDNALWGYVQPIGGWESFAERAKAAELKAQERRRRILRTEEESAGSYPRYERDLQETGALIQATGLDELMNKPEADMFAHGETDQSQLVPVFARRSFVDDICFGGATFEECLATLDRLLTRFTECRISISFTKSLFCKKKVDFLSHVVTDEGLAADPKKLDGILKLPFPTTKRGMQSFLGALNYYSRFIQDLPVYGGVLYQLREEDFGPDGDLRAAKKAFEALKEKVAAAPLLIHFKENSEVHVMLYANKWAISGAVMQIHEGQLRPVRFVGRVLQDAETRYFPAELEVLALLRVLRVCYTQLRGKVINVYTRFSTLKWIFEKTTMFGRSERFAVLLSPWHLKVKKVSARDYQFMQLLHASITPSVTLDESLAGLEPPAKGSGPVARLDPELLYAKLAKGYDGYVMTFDGSAKPEKSGRTGSSAWILWKLPAWTITEAATLHLPSATVNEAEYIAMNRGVEAALSRGVTNLVIAGDSRLAIQQAMGAIHCHKDTLRVHLARHKQLVARLRDVRYLHAAREYNAAADSLASEALGSEASKIVLDEERKTQLGVLNRMEEVIYEQTVAEREPSREVEPSSAEEEPAVTVLTRSRSQHRVRFREPLQVDDEPVAGDARSQSPDPSDPQSTEPEESTARAPPTGDPLATQRERLRRISRAQDEEDAWLAMKRYLRGDLDRLSRREAQRCGKVAEHYVLNEEDVLYYVDKGRKLSYDESVPTLKLVVPTTLIYEVLHVCHTSFEGGHQGILRTFKRVQRSYYWRGLYVDCKMYVESCPDCCSSKGKPQLRGFSPGNIQPERPFQLVSMDFVIPLPTTKRGNKALLLFQCTFTGFVVARAMSDTNAHEVAKAFEECIYRHWGAPTLIRHDRDPRFMSEVFREFRDSMRSRSRATLSYRPQANGQQERSVQSMISAVRVYAEDPLQQDWDDIAERLAMAINTSMDTTRKETPFYLVHGWDPATTLDAMTSSFKGRGDSSDAAAWRRQVNRQLEIAHALAKKYQREEQRRRAAANNAQLGRLELPMVNEDQDDPESEASAENAFTPRRLVWLYMARVKPGLTKKLAHLWHGPFRIKRQVDRYAVELELPDRSGYRFHPTVHIARLKLVREHRERPTVRLAEGLELGDRLDFDEELLPEDSWEREAQDDEYEVEAIIDDRLGVSTRGRPSQREFLVKWKGYDEPTWEPERHLACGGLLFDYLQQKKRDQRLQMVQSADEA